jgi:Flp pilus assembly CpaE family ATPase
VLAVGAADPIGLQRLVRAVAEVRDIAPTAQLRVVVNKLRRGPVGADPQKQVAAALERYAGVRDAVFVPYDRAGLDAALASGRTLADVAAGSPGARCPDGARGRARGSGPGVRRGRRRRLRRGA